MLINTTERYFVLKNLPKKPDTVEFEYYVAYIDRSTFVPMKMEFFKTGEKLYRVIETVKLKNIPAVKNGEHVIYPTVTESVARDLENGSETKMVFSDIQYNLSLGDKIFTERFLRRPPRDAIR